VSASVAASTACGIPAATNRAAAAFIALRRADVCNVRRQRFFGNIDGILGVTAGGRANGRRRFVEAIVGVHQHIERRGREAGAVNITLPGECIERSSDQPGLVARRDHDRDPAGRVRRGHRSKRVERHDHLRTRRSRR
jgi:hypothetical protein